MDERWVRVLVTAAIWVVVVVLVRWALRRAFVAWERRHVDTDVAAIARRRTAFSFLSRIAVAIVALIGAWSVLSIFPNTDDIARALLASSAVLAVVAGLALTTPLGNLGAGVLVSFTQPVRLGDRVTIGEHTGAVEDISLIYTRLVTDDARRVYVPNTQLTTAPVVNRTIRDPRRAVMASLPVRIDAPIPAVREAALAALRALPGLLPDAPRVVIGEIRGGTFQLDVTAYAPLGADVAQLGSDVREALLGTLARGGYLSSA